jgi:glycosyltransferase involved in cell wall biosynthesis
LPANARAIGWMTREQIVELYRSAQVLVVPSRWEGFGLVALEAMRCGCAVFASRVGGLEEVVDDGVSGLLFEPEDSAALAALLKNTTAPQLLAFGTAGRRRFERMFRIERVEGELDALYRAMLARQPVAVEAASLRLVR